MKKPQTIQKRVLQLRGETLRDLVLSNTQLAVVAGGGVTGPISFCPCKF